MFEGKTAAYIIADALRDFSESFRFLGGDERLGIALNEQHYYILLNLTHDSGEGRNNPDECRIQVGPSHVRAYKPGYISGQPTLVCGYEPKYEVFTVWETELVLGRNPSTFSVYSRYSALEEARQFGFSTYEFKSQILQRQSRAINFRPEYLGVVLENSGILFEFDLDALYEVRDFFVSTKKQVGPRAGGIKASIRSIKGKKIEVRRLAYVRDPNFRRNVMLAYGSKCCVCGIQLNLVDAAHIVPHSKESSDDGIGNGLALCAIHHRAYDSGLLIPHEDFVLRINDERVAYLRERGLDGELDQIQQYHGQAIVLPDGEENWPDPENLLVGKQMRLA